MTALALLKLVDYFLISIAISKQLNAAPCLRNKPLLWEETMPAILNSRFHVCTIVSLPDQWLWERDYGENGILRNRQQPRDSENGVLRNRQKLGRAENSFIDQSEFVAIKTVSGCKARHCDKHQFPDKMTVCTWTVFKIFVLNFVV